MVSPFLYFHFTMNKKKTNKSGCFGCIGIVIVALFLFYMLGQSNTDDEIDWTEATIISQEYIKNHMKFPDDVEFVQASQKVIKEQNKIFKVTGRLKANNMFGQAVPYTYNVRVQYNGGNWNDFTNGMPSNWTFLGGNLYNEATQEFTEIE